MDIEDQRVINERLTKTVESESTVSGRGDHMRRRNRSRRERRRREQQRRRRQQQRNRRRARRGRRGRRGGRSRDPIAQTFQVSDNHPNGVFVTSVDIFFQSKDDALPVTLQIRPVETGVPSSVILPFGEVVLDPNEVEVSQDASVPTKFTFESPLYLQVIMNVLQLF